jgi:MATE family multidrug resistance protein
MAELAIQTTTNVVTSGPPHKAILSLALPTVVAMLTQSVVNEIDIVFFARLPTPRGRTRRRRSSPRSSCCGSSAARCQLISVGTQALTGRRFAEGASTDAGAVLPTRSSSLWSRALSSRSLGYLSCR